MVVMIGRVLCFVLFGLLIAAQGARANGTRMTSATVFCAPDPVAVGAMTTCTFTVADTDSGTPSAPTGIVSYQNGGAKGSFSPGDSGHPSSGACVLAAVDSAHSSCQATYVPGQRGTGVHTIQALYLGDAAHTSNTNQDNSFALTISRTTSTTVGCGPASVFEGRSTVCTATVADTDSGTPVTPGGAISFGTNGSGSFSAPGGSCALAPVDATHASCHVTYTPLAAGSGTHTITAAYNPSDGAHLSSQSQFDLAVAPPRPATSTINCTPSSAIVGQSALCTATVVDSGSGAPSTPGGSVSFSSDGAGSFGSGGSCALMTVDASHSSCQVSYTPASVGAGTHKISGAYAATDGVHSDAQGSFNLAVTAPVTAARSTSTVVSCLPARVTVGRGTVCTATVTDSAPGPPGTPGGSVAFSSDGAGTFSAPGPSCTLIAVDAAHGSCQVTYTPSVPGSASHRLTGAYDGSDRTHAASQASFGLVVDPPRATSTALTCVPGSLKVGQATVCTASVSDSAPGTPSAPGGSAVFTSGGEGSFTAPGGSCSLVAKDNSHSDCQVTYTPTSAGLGLHPLTAAYDGGDRAHAASSGGAVLTVIPEPVRTVTTVGCVPHAVAVGQTVVCTVAVGDLGAAPSAATGSVTLATGSPGSLLPASCTFTATGAKQASCQVLYTPTGFGSGTHVLTATYHGDATHAPSTGTGAVTVLRPVSVGVSCAPDSVLVLQKTECTVTVSDAGPGSASAPTGTVFADSAAPGTFSNPPGGFSEAPSCTLAPTDAPGHSACTIDYTPTRFASGTHALAFDYSGDADYAPESGSLDLTVTKRHTYIDDSRFVFCGAVLDDPMVCVIPVRGYGAGVASVPQGTLSFSVQTGAGSFSGNCTLDPRGTCPMTYTPSGSIDPSPGAPARRDRITMSFVSSDDEHENFAQTSAFAVQPRGGAWTTRCDHEWVHDILNNVAQPYTVAETAIREGQPISCVIRNNDVKSPPTGTIRIAREKVSVDAVYLGDASHGGSGSQCQFCGSSVKGSQHPSRTGVDCTPTPLVVTDTTTCTAYVGDQGAVLVKDRTGPQGALIAPSGKVTFSGGGSCQLQKTGASTSSCSTKVRPRATVTASGVLTPGSACTVSGGVCRLTYTPSVLSQERHETLQILDYTGDSKHSGWANPHGPLRDGIPIRILAKDSKITLRGQSLDAPDEPNRLPAPPPSPPDSPTPSKLRSTLEVGVAVRPGHVMIKQNEAGPEPVKVKVKVTVRNHGTHPLEHVYLPRELLFSWNGPAPVGAIPLKHVTSPGHLDLGPLAPGEVKSDTYLIEVHGDGEFEIAASVDGLDAKGTKVPGLGRTLFKPQSQVLVFEAKQGAKVPSQTFPAAILAGTHYLIRVTLENRSYFRTLDISPITADKQGNATDGHLQPVGQPIPSEATGSMGELRRSEVIVLPPRSGKHEYDVIVRTSASDAWTVPNPDETASEWLLGHRTSSGHAPSHAGGSRSEVSFRPPTVFSLAKGEVQQIARNAVVMTGQNQFTLHVDDGAPPPWGESVFGPLGPLLYTTAGEIKGLWNATFGTLYDFGHWALITAPTGAATYLIHLMDLWAAVRDDPALRKQWIDETVARTMKSYESIRQDPALLAKYFGAGVTNFSDAAFKLARDVDAAVFQRYTRSQQEICCGDWRKGYFDVGAEGGEQAITLAVGLAPAVLARLPAAAVKLAAFKTEQFTKAAGLITPIIDRVAPVKQALFALEKYGQVGLKVTDKMAEVFAGLSKTEADWLRAFTQRTGLKVSLRPRLAQSLAWLEQGAIPKPFWLKLKNVNRIDADFLGFRDADIASLVFNEHLPTPDQVRTLMKEKGLKPKTAWGADNPEWTGVLKRLEQRQQENDTLLKEYRGWAKDGSRVEEWPYEANVGPEAAVPRGPKQSFGFQLRSDGPNGQYLVVEVNPRGAQLTNAPGWVRVTGDTDIVAITHADWTPLSEAEHIAAVEEVRHGPLHISNPESATWQQDGKFDPKEFPAKMRELTNDGKCCLLTSDADGQIRMTQFDPNLSVFNNQGDYRVALLGALEIPWHVTAFGVLSPLRQHP